MINFYRFYNKTGLDNEHYGPIIEKAHNILNNKSSYDLKLIEHIIKKSPQHAYYYARYVIKDRWYEAEPVIVKDRDYAYCYARDIIKGRWIEAEPYIEQDGYWWDIYCEKLIIYD